MGVEHDRREMINVRYLLDHRSRPPCKTDDLCAHVLSRLELSVRPSTYWTGLDSEADGLLIAELLLCHECTRNPRPCAKTICVEPSSIRLAPN